MKIIGLAGGSGAGKSSLSHALTQARPELFSVVHLDDYHRRRDQPDLPRLHGFINWDHPDILRWGDLIRDLDLLKSGQTITIQTKDRQHNPDYEQHRQPVKLIIEPRPILIVEGYLALYNPDVRQRLDKAFYLDASSEVRLSRRDKQALTGGNDYDRLVLLPMHDQYVEPTKRDADMVINTDQLPTAEVVKIIIANLPAA